MDLPLFEGKKSFSPRSDSKVQRYREVTLIHQIEMRQELTPQSPKSIISSPRPPPAPPRQLLLSANMYIFTPVISFSIEFTFF